MEGVQDCFYCKSLPSLVVYLVGLVRCLQASNTHCQEGCCAIFVFKESCEVKVTMRFFQVLPLLSLEQ